MFQKLKIYIWKKVVYFELRKLCGYPLWISFPELCTAPTLEAKLAWEFMFKLGKWSTFLSAWGAERQTELVNFS